MKTKKNMKNYVSQKRFKKKYISPKIEVLKIDMENGIATSSAIIKPANTVNEVKNTWKPGTDMSATLEW